ncbi:unnamed protein product, partial [Ectocarpus sp. 12 AP-2014]
MLACVSAGVTRRRVFFVRFVFNTALALSLLQYLHLFARRAVHFVQACTADTYAKYAHVLTNYRFPPLNFNLFLLFIGLTTRPRETGWLWLRNIEWNQAYLLQYHNHGVGNRSSNPSVADSANFSPDTIDNCKFPFRRRPLCRCADYSHPPHAGVAMVFSQHEQCDGVYRGYFGSVFQLLPPPS